MVYMVLALSISVGLLAGWFSHHRKRGRQRVVHKMDLPNNLLKDIPEFDDEIAWASAMTWHPKDAMTIGKIIDFLKKEKNNQKKIKRAFKYKQGFLIPVEALEEETIIRPLKKGLWQRVSLSTGEAIAFRVLSSLHLLLETGEQYRISKEYRDCHCVMVDKSTAQWPVEAGGVMAATATSETSVAPESGGGSSADGSSDSGGSSGGDGG